MDPTTLDSYDSIYTQPIDPIVDDAYKLDRFLSISGRSLELPNAYLHYVVNTVNLRHRISNQDFRLRSNLLNQGFNILEHIDDIYITQYLSPINGRNPSGTSFSLMPHEAYLVIDKLHMYVSSISYLEHEVNMIRVTAASDDLVDLESLYDFFSWWFIIPRKASRSQQQQTTLTFSYFSADGPQYYQSKLQTPNWEKILSNYPVAIRSQLDKLLADKRNVFDRGKIILALGEPGTGKTFFLRSLCYAWAKSFNIYSVTDIDRLCNEPSYVQDIIGHSRRSENIRSILLIMEDAGEYLANNAKDRQGQGFSRLLNLSDGLMGQVNRICFFISSNEFEDDIHPAILRPGRTAAILKFPLFSEDEANEWLLKHKGEPIAKGYMTLAEMYSSINGNDAEAIDVNKRRSLGFV